MTNQDLIAKLMELTKKERENGFKWMHPSVCSEIDQMVSQANQEGGREAESAYLADSLALMLDGGRKSFLRSEIEQVLTNYSHNPPAQELGPGKCSYTESGVCSGTKCKIEICENPLSTRKDDTSTQELPAPKKCPHYGDGIQSNDGCPGSINARHCPDNTDEDCNLLPAKKQKGKCSYDESGVCSGTKCEIVTCRNPHLNEDSGKEWVGEPASTSQEGLREFIAWIENQLALDQDENVNAITQSTHRYREALHDCLAKAEVILSRHPAAPVRDGLTAKEREGLLGYVDECWAHEALANPRTIRAIINQASHPAVAPESVEPLAVLADRKGFWKTRTIRSYDSMANDYWTVSVERTSFDINTTPKRVEEFVASTYAEAESEARAYLQGLDDVKGGK